MAEVVATCHAGEAAGLVRLFWEKCWAARDVAAADGLVEEEAGPAGVALAALAVEEEAAAAPAAGGKIKMI